jgi:hypothetical protein
MDSSTSTASLLVFPTITLSPRPLPTPSPIPSRKNVICRLNNVFRAGRNEDEGIAHLDQEQYEQLQQAVCLPHPAPPVPPKTPSVSTPSPGAPDSQVQSQWSVDEQRPAVSSKTGGEYNTSSPTVVSRMPEIQQLIQHE